MASKVLKENSNRRVASCNKNKSIKHSKKKSIKKVEQENEEEDQVEGTMEWAKCRNSGKKPSRQDDDWRRLNGSNCAVTMAALLTKG